MKNNSSDRLPYFQFYPADWLTDTSLRLCSAETRGVWIDLLCHMSLSNERGFLIVGGQILDENGIRKLSGLSPKKFKKVLNELTLFGILKRDENGRFFSKRMVGDERLRQVRRDVGKKGGNPNLKKPVVDLVHNLVNQNENQNSTLSKVKSQSHKKKDKLSFFKEEKNEDVTLILNPVLQYIQKNCPTVARLSKQLSEIDAEELLQKFPVQEIFDVLDQMENFKPLVSKYSSVKLTLNSWIKNKNANYGKSTSNSGSKKPSFENAIRDF